MIWLETGGTLGLARFVCGRKIFCNLRSPWFVQRPACCSAEERKGEPMHLRLLVAVLGLCWVCGVASRPLEGQSSGGASGQGFTLRSETRSVLTDVTVTDRNGNPVHGLPASAFHIFDDNRPQDIASFEEHSAPVGGAADAAPAAAAGVYSNALQLHPPSVMNILLLDTTNMRMEDQMYLSIQLSKFLKTLGPGNSWRFICATDQVTIQLQGFTADHALLTAAIHKGLPRFMPTGRQYLSDAETLHQLAIYLGQLPGRKNVLWFSGGSTAFLLADDDEMGVFNMGMVNPDLRRMYDELESSRIAVYPIDARGLTLRHNATVTRAAVGDERRGRGYGWAGLLCQQRAGADRREGGRFGWQLLYLDLLAAGLPLRQ